MKPAVWLAAAALIAGSAPAAWAMSLNEAFAAARAYNPVLAQKRAAADAADARRRQALGALLPNITISGEVADGRTDLGGFFGFGESEVRPSAAQIMLRQPLFAGGALAAGIEQAGANSRAASAWARAADAMLLAEVAKAYSNVQVAREREAIMAKRAAVFSEITRQAQLRFDAGEIPNSDLALARARLGATEAEVAHLQAAALRAEAYFESVVGQPAPGLEPAPEPPETPETSQGAMALAERGNAQIIAAQEGLISAETGVRAARAGRLPTLALVAKSSSVRDQFLPGYRAESASIGVEGHWNLFAGGAISARQDEAQAEHRRAQAALIEARAAVREAVIGANGDLRASRPAGMAAEQQLAASMAALDSIRHEVRVGQRPLIDLLAAETATGEAKVALVAARGQAMVSAYQLLALIGKDLTAEAENGFVGAKR
jgi:outer membrane protein